jgi:dienelactone hydrolase
MAVLRGRGLALVAGLGVALSAPASAAAFDPVTEAQNFSKGNERQAIYQTPAYQAQLRLQSQVNAQAALMAQASDPEREFVSDLCWNGGDGCAGDVRLYQWQSSGYGIVQPFLYTARDGATISGHIWATRAGPAKRPGIVITNGSVQADEQLYWFAAQALAKDGYVVMTWDPQGQGQSDTRGETPDQSEGFPAQSDGRPFFDGSEDALNFFFSTPSHPYSPVPSCSTGTSHDAKQARRVRAGLDAAYNPFWSLLDPSRVGIAGHSYGAAGVSYIGQFDPRVKAIVAWDNLAGTDPTKPGATGSGAVEQPCPGVPGARRVAAITKPALGMSADYFIPPTPNTSQPDPAAKQAESLVYSKLGVDTGEVIIRGGTHYDFDWIPNPGFPATLRGADLIDWYTTAWFDKYVKGDPTADARLLTNRWRHDAPEGAVDPNHDANIFSFYHRSRLDIGTAHGRVDCENLRDGCAALSDADGYPGTYDWYRIVTAKDGPATAGTVPHSPAGLPSCPAPRGSLAGRRLGAIALGMTRAQTGRALGHSTTHGRRSMDYFCLLGGLTRVGYTHGRATLALTFNRHFALDGVRPGARVSQVSRNLALGRGFHVGPNVWYLTRRGATLGVVKVLRGTVVEVGVAEPGANRTRAASARFLRSFR